jgi:hypothetical protein
VNKRTALNEDQLAVVRLESLLRKAEEDLAAARSMAEHERELTRRMTEDRDAWEQLARDQHALVVEHRGKWPPASIKCGWCIQAAGDDQAASDAAQVYSLAEVRAHARVCPHSPLVRERLSSMSPEGRATYDALLEKYFGEQRVEVEKLRAEVERLRSELADQLELNKALARGDAS